MDNIFAQFKRVRQALRHLTTIAEQASEAITVVDLNGILRFVNKTAAKMHGYNAPNELVGKPITVFHTAEQIKTDVIPFIEEVKQSGQSVYLVKHIRKDGTPFQTETKMVLLRDDQGKSVGFAFFFEDITERRKAEKSLEEKLEALTSENEKLQHELDSTNQQLQNQIDQRQRTDSQLEQLRNQLQESIEQKTTELAQAQEQLQQQITERQQAESRLEEYRHQLEQQAAELTEMTEQLRLEHIEKERLEEEYDQSAPGSEAASGEAKPVDPEKLKALADLARRLR